MLHLVVKESEFDNILRAASSVVSIYSVWLMSNQYALAEKAFPSSCCTYVHNRTTPTGIRAVQEGQRVSWSLGLFQRC